MTKSRFTLKNLNVILCFSLGTLVVPLGLRLQSLSLAHEHDEEDEKRDAQRSNHCAADDPGLGKKLT